MHQIEKPANTLKEILHDCLSQQMSEFELLNSMYPNSGEIVLSDKNIISEINNFIEQRTDYIPNHLEFKVNLLVDKIKLEIFINLPSSYPKEEPDIYVRCNQLNRQKESKLNSELLNYIKQNHFGEVCLYTAISWLQENFDCYLADRRDTTSDDSDESSEKDEFARLWIYSHHIYNKKKREEIVKKAKELKLTGFSLPGKPGIVCIEGLYGHCKEYWKYIKTMCWKKIVIKKTEVYELDTHETHKKFSNFQELNMDNKGLSKYMLMLGFGDVFNELFGL